MSLADCQMRRKGHRPGLRAFFRYFQIRSEEHTSELQSRFDLVCRLLLEKKNLIYSRKQAQALSSHSHPPDRASYVDADGRPIHSPDHPFYVQRRLDLRLQDYRPDDLGRG